MLVTRFGVSVENVVATIETPTSHQRARVRSTRTRVSFAASCAPTASLNRNSARGSALRVEEGCELPLEHRQHGRRKAPEIHGNELVPMERNRLPRRRVTGERDAAR